MNAARPARLFGLDVTADFAIAGVTPEPIAPPGEAPALRLRLAAAEAIRARWTVDAPAPAVLSDRRDEAGATVQRVEHDEGAGALLVARGWGTYRIDTAAAAAWCAPEPAGEAWRWQRYLIGQVLPFAALLHGFEVLHAGAVAAAGGAVAIVGQSRSGKSTLAAAWMCRGAPLVADDVVALRVEDDGPPVVYPGPGLVSLRAGAPAPAGRQIGADELGRRLAVTREARPLRLRALVMLRRTGALGALALARDPAPPAPVLLAQTFNFVLRTPDRLTALLDVAAAIATRVPVINADIPDGIAPGAVVDALERELGQ